MRQRTPGVGFIFSLALPDGCTLLVSPLGAFVVTPHLQKSVGYDATRDFDYLSVPLQAPSKISAA